MMHIEVVSDAICPWCFIGKRHMDTALAMLAKEGLTFTVEWRPYQLNPDMPQDGVPRASYRAAKFGSAARAQELDASVANAGRVVGLEFHFDRMERTPNTIEAHRAIRLAGEVGLQDAMVERLFEAYFQNGRDIGSPSVLAEIAQEIGMDPALLAGDRGKADVLADDSAARNAGLNGVPSFLMEGYLLFSGAMPAEAMANNFRKAHDLLSTKAA
jgi:predicted DsbA family dithiol-disulfide isomerase